MTELKRTRDGCQALRAEGELIIAATSEKPMTDEAVDEFIVHLGALMNGRSAITAILQYSPTQSPNALQRKRMMEAQAMNQPIKRIAILTQSKIVRGAVTALAWFAKSGPQTRAFSIDRHADALKWLSETARFDRVAAPAVLKEVTSAVGLTMTTT